MLLEERVINLQETKKELIEDVNRRKTNKLTRN